MIAAAIIIDWLVGDPKWLTHPVILIGRWIKRVERLLYKEEKSVNQSNRTLIYRGSLLAASTLLVSTGLIMLLSFVSWWIHPWLGYVVNTWFISTTIAVKGLKDAAMLVYHPLVEGI